MQHCARVMLVTLLTVLVYQEAGATEELRVVNNTGRMMQFWIWSYTNSQWRQPVYFTPGERKYVYFNSGEDYFMRFKDLQGHRRDVGRFNITRVLRQYPDYELAIAQMVEAATTEQVYYVWCPYHRTWHRMVRTIERPDSTPQYDTQWRRRSEGR